MGDQMERGKNWLCDPCNLLSMRIAYPWHEDHFKPGGHIYEMVERAKRYRDGTPLERLTMDIEDAKGRCDFEQKYLGAKSPKSIEHLRQLKEQR